MMAAFGFVSGIDRIVRIVGMMVSVQFCCSNYVGKYLYLLTIIIYNINKKKKKYIYIYIYIYTYGYGYIIYFKL